MNDRVLDTRKRILCVGLTLAVLLSAGIVAVIFDDIEGPVIYEVDILPISPKEGDIVNFVIYCIDPSGVSGAVLCYSLNGNEWTEQEMRFYACLCVAGGRWEGVIGPIQSGDDIQVSATAFDSSPARNEASTQVFQIEVSAS